MMKTTIQATISLFVTLLLTTGVAFAAPKLELSMVVEKEIKETMPNGQVLTRRVQTEDATQGETLFYTIRFRNVGDEMATNLQLDNPIAEGVTYQADSAWGKGSEILFSADQGKSFKKPAEMTYQVTGRDGRTEQRRVEPEKYSAIRWVIKQIPAGSEGEVGFNVLVN